MFMPRGAEYAIRCMAQIALLPWESSITAEELQGFVHVPRGYLSKILRKLVAAGLLSGEKGRGGGFRLASPPSVITFLMILDGVGFAIKPNRCAFGWGQCNSENPCPLHETFSKLNTQFIEWASRTTLADVNRTSELISRMKRISRSVKG